MDSIYTLAYFFYTRGDYSKAEMNFRRCLEGRRKLLMPEDHVDVKAAREYLTKCQIAEVPHPTPPIYCPVPLPLDALSKYALLTPPIISR